MLKHIITIAALLFTLGLCAQVNVQKVASKNQAVFTAQPTRILVEGNNPQTTKGSFTSPAITHMPGNSAKQTPRSTEVFGVEPRRTKPTK